MRKVYYIKQTPAGRVFDAVNGIVIALLMFLMIYPFWNMLILSFNDGTDALLGKLYFWPRVWTLSNYEYVFKNRDLLHGALVSVLRVVVGTVTGVICNALLGYIVSCRQFYGRKFMRLLFIITMYFGGGLIPTYLIVKNIGLLNRAITLVVLGSASIYNLIVTRSFFQSTLPDALFESALIDGASEFRMFISIALPLSGSIIAVMALYFGVARWNEFFNALIYVSSTQFQPLQLVLRTLLLQSQQAVLDAALTNDSEMLADAARLALMAEAMKYAIIFIASAPLLIAYPFVQKHFVKGVMIGALKG